MVHVRCVIAGLLLIGIIACKPEVKRYSAQQLTDPNDTTETVELSAYMLIAPEGADRTNDANEIMKLKRRWPLAMQSLDVNEFEAILSSDFTFKSPDEFFNRTEYIQNRTRPDDWKITFVKYDNVTLQFTGEESAVLSYRNHIRNEHSVTHETEIEHITWVDTFVKEQGDWKIQSSHAIDYSVEPMIIRSVIK